MNISEALASGIPTLIVAFFRLLLMSSDFVQHLPYDFDTDALAERNYDFIVVGAGSAGCVVASRLSETGARVLVLEAGGSAPPETATPYLTPYVLGGEYDWRIKGAPQRNAQTGYVNNSGYMHSARMMGGTSSMDGMMYVRGNRADYNNWADMGNPGWDWDSVLPYFKKSVNFVGKLPSSADRSHYGIGGPLTVSSSQHPTMIQDAFQKALMELGYSYVDGFGPSQIGVGPVFSAIKDGLRHSSAEAFLRPLVHRRNLHIRPNAYVTKVLFNDQKRAVAVQYRLQGELRIAVARKEVIIAAGALNSPKLLMLSGVGPARHLSTIGIPLVAAVEGVGQNLQDHPTVYLAWKVNKRASTTLLDLWSPIGIANYFRTTRGLPGTSPRSESNAWLNLGGDDHSWADVHLGGTSISYSADLGATLIRATGLRKEIYYGLYGSFLGAATLTINTVLARPKSRGSVTLASSDPMALPIPDLNFFDHPDDMRLMLKAIRYALKIGETDSIKRGLGAQFQFANLQPCQHLVRNSDAYWECYAKTVINTHWHYSGTCKMAPDRDPMGVVSPRLRVRGVSGLRVIDASIMPQLISSMILAPTYMIAEKGSDMIKEDWGYPINSQTT